jgi:hypothetical protein
MGREKTKTEESREVLIANPSYDHVFGYMMEDNGVARQFISAIIGEEIVELSLVPQERKDSPGEKRIAYRLDYFARIKRKGGLKPVMIEVQKASHENEIMRFRRYLNDYAGSPEVGGALPFYCIFFIGSGIGLEDVPVVTVSPSIFDVNDDQKLEGLYSEFVEVLHHRFWIIQLSELKGGRRRNDLETLLNVFDQSYRTGDPHLLKLDVAHFPEKYRSIVYRLQLAAANKSVRDEMLREDKAFSHQREDTANR